jgi:hypothetical protein
MSNDITLITPSADLLAALQAWFGTVLQLYVYRVAAGNVTSRALIGKAGQISVYLLPPSTNFSVSNVLPDGVAMPTNSGNSLAAPNNLGFKMPSPSTTVASTAMTALNTYLGVTASKSQSYYLSGTITSSTTYSTDAITIATLGVMPSGFVHSNPLQAASSPMIASPSSSASSMLPLMICIGGLLVLVVIGVCVWLYLRKKSIASTAVDVPVT